VAGAHLVGVHGLAMGHVHALGIENLACLEIALGDRATAPRAQSCSAPQNARDDRDEEQQSGLGRPAEHLVDRAAEPVQLVDIVQFADLNDIARILQAA